MRRVGGALAMVLAGLALGACGTPSPDLFVVQRAGSVPGAKFNLLVSDTSVRCNHGAPIPLTSAQTLQARDILRDLLALQKGRVTVPASPPSQLYRFEIRDENGVLRFADTTQRPVVLPRTAYFIRRVAIDTCKLTR